MKKGPWAEIALTGAVRFFGLGSTALFLFISARYLGPEDRGRFVVLTTWGTSIGALIGVCIGQSAQRSIASSGDVETRERTLGVLIGVVLTVSALTIAVLAVIRTIGEFPMLFSRLSLYNLALGVPILVFTLWEQAFGAALNTLRGTSPINVATAIGRATSMLLGLCVVLCFNKSMEGLVLSGLTGQALTVVLLLCYGVRGAPTLSHDTEISGKIAGGIAWGALMLLPNGLGGFLFTGATILILNLYCSPSETAYFQLAAQCVSLVGVFPLAIAAVSSAEIGVVGCSGAWAKTRELLPRTMLIVSGSIMIAIVIAPLLIPVLAGQGFSGAVAPLQAMSIAGIGISLSIIMGPQWIGRGYFKIASGITFCSGLVNIIICIILIPRWGIWGGVFAYIGTYMSSVLGNALFAIYITRLDRVEDPFSKYRATVCGRVS